MFDVQKTGYSHPWMLLLKRVRTAVADTVFPLRCISCGQVLQRKTAESQSDRSSPSDGRETADVFQKTMATHLCEDCLSGFSPVLSPICPVCGSMFESRQGRDHRCGRCIRTPRLFSRARSAGLHRGGLKKAVHGLKYGGKLQLVRPLGRLLVDTWRKYWVADEMDAVIAVPLHAGRLRKRGFNQSGLLVREMRRQTFKSVRLAAPAGGKDALVRTRRTMPQTGLGRSERIDNIRNAFSVPSPQAVSGKRLLLVDDVLTTGATVEECARVLLGAGAERVDVLTLSRAE